MVGAFEATGMRRLAPLLALLSLIAQAQPPKRVWIDTDPSVAPGGHEVDDGIALLQAFASPELDIRGISIVFGNADLSTASRIGKEIVRKFGPKSATVHAGASSRKDLGKETAASAALKRELERGPLTVIALGPVTNIATVVRNHPMLAARIENVIVVAGRRPGQQFNSGPAQKIPFRDLNFELDPEGMQVLLASNVPLILTPWEISSQVWLTHDDVTAAASGNAGMLWLLPAATDWLALWSREFGTTGFNPFDALAVGYLVDRQDLDCGSFSAKIETGPDDTSLTDAPPQKPFLVVRPVSPDKRSVTYCHTAKAGFKVDLVRRLSQGRH